AEWGVGLEDDDSLHAVGPFLQQRQLQELRCCDGKREGGQRQIDAFQSERRQAEQETDNETDQSRRRYRPGIAEAEMVHDDGRDIGTGGVEGAMSERKLAVDAGQ